MTVLSEIWKPEDHLPEEVKILISQGAHKENPRPGNYVLALLNVIHLLKLQRRTGWVEHGIEKCESIADHMYRMGITSMMITDPAVNRDTCCRIALVHDLAESLVGDLTPSNPIGKDEKHRREWETIKYLCETIVKPYNADAAEQIQRDWLAYEEVSSLEARYVKDIDKYEMLVQCLEYEKMHPDKSLDEFYSAVESVKTKEIRSWVDDLLEQRKLLNKGSR